MNKKQLEDRVDYLTIVVVGLVALLAVNYTTDFMYMDVTDKRLDIHLNHIIDLKVSDFEQNKLFEQLDKDVESNYKVVNQLIGIILRDEI